MTITTHPAAQPRAEAGLAARLVELLRAEHELLRGGDDDAVAGLPALAADKERLGFELRAALRAAPRAALLGLAAIPAGAARSQADAALSTLLAEIRTMNEINGRFVASRLTYVRARLGGLIQSGNAAGLYAADGSAGRGGPRTGIVGQA